MKILSEKEVLDHLNATHGVKISRQLFAQSLRPLFVERGEARRIGAGNRATWVYDPKDLWQWQQYLAVRAELVRRREWHANRPYSVRDLEDIGLLDEYAEIVDELNVRKEG